MAVNLVSAQDMFHSKAEPYLGSRFEMLIDGIPAFIITSTGKPRFSQEKVVIPHINSERYIKGKTKWQSIEVKVIDYIAPASAQTIMEWQLIHNESVTGRDGYADMYKKDVLLRSLGPVGDRTQEWMLKGVFIESANFGDLDKSSSELVQITLSLSYDYAYLNY